jgi:hypothetical protein
VSSVHTPVSDIVIIATFDPSCAMFKCENHGYRATAIAVSVQRNTQRFGVTVNLTSHFEDVCTSNSVYFYGRCY